MNLLVLILIAVLAVKASQPSWSEFSEAVQRARWRPTSSRWAPPLAALITLRDRALIARVPVRYSFPAAADLRRAGRPAVALPTAVAGPLLSLLRQEGLVGQFLRAASGSRDPTRGPPWFSS